MSDLTAETIKEIVALSTPIVLTSELPGGQPAVMVPNDFKVCVLPTDRDLADRPVRIKAHVKLFEPDSFLKYWLDFRDENSRVFADEKTGSILGILDYHEDRARRMDDGKEEVDAAPRWCQHRVELTLRKSEEWILWTGQNQKRMTQDDFARFVEDNAPDLTEPDPATMLEIARSMVAKCEINMESYIRTNKGATFRYNEVTKAGGIGPAGEFSVPDEFKLAIPVYVGTEPVAMRARLRYQIASGKLAMWYDLFRHQQVERAAFKSVLVDIAGRADTAVLNGQPA